MKYINTFFKAGLVYPALLVAMLIALYVVPAVAEDTPYPEPRPATQLLLNITIPCREDGVIFLSELMEIYGEQEFASGTFKFKPIGSPNFVYADLLMYVSPDRKTFSIFSLHTVGNYEIACVLAGGNDLKPFTGEYRE